tara:strand:- start:460 stop:693 length:234 start_codon:yes stop_codon:yes gene_type:complete
METINLVPIKKIKISKEKWLKSKLKYDNILTYNDIIEQMCERTYNWISSKDDLDIVSDYNTFKNDFINLMYDKYYNE